MEAKSPSTDRWNEIKIKIKSKWSKLPDNEIDSLKADLAQLANHLERAYGYSKDFAQYECTHFRASIQEHPSINDLNLKERIGK